MRDSDVAYGHLEGIIHDYAGPELYPAAEGGWVWMRTPSYAAEELRWAGLDLVSTASNHALDYSYGGLFSTWQALGAAGIAHAGTGRTLDSARAPAFVERDGVRVGLVSMCSSFPAWARAGAQRPDSLGRPGLNPLRIHYEVDEANAEAIIGLAKLLGYWVTVAGEQVLVNPPGLHNTIYRFVLSATPGVTAAIDEDDATANLRAIAEASELSDIVIAHLHTHEWNVATNELSAPAPFVQPFARACIDAGASIVVAQGAHAPLRGIEFYQGRPIFYDPGDFIKGSNLVDRHPADFYARADYGLRNKFLSATPAEGHHAMVASRNQINPPAGYSRVPGSVIGLCTFGDGFELDNLELVAIRHVAGERTIAGLPAIASASQAELIFAHIQELSVPYGTKLVAAGTRATVSSEGA
jgi:poly-gamma-glutamate capsule biosynthesis protein CapA/YwtB (metallophosphatase superfamily)